MRTIKNYSIEEQLELYEAMLGAQPQSMFLLDKDKNFIGIFNPTPETLGNYRVDDIIGNNILKYANDPTSPLYEACTMLNATFDPVFKTGNPLKFQCMILDACLEATITKLSDDRILSLVRDITDIISQIRDAEEAKRNELSVALIAGGLTSWTYDVEGQIISTTHDNNVIQGELSLAELLELIIPEHRSVVMQMFDDIISREKNHAHITVRAMNIEGHYQWSDVHAIPDEFSSDGRVTRIVGSQKDATKEFEYQNRLKKLNMQNELILNNTHSGFVYLTAGLKVEWENVSKVFKDTEISRLFLDDAPFGCVQEKLMNSNFIGVSEALRTKKQVKKKVQIDSSMTIESIVQPVSGENNELEGLVVRIDDVTEKDQFVQELAEAKEKAEQSDKLKSAFLANMSHEIRTPLNSIVGFSQILPEVETKEEQMSYINIINSNSQILLNLINDILDLSKIEAGYLTCNNEVFNLNDLFFQTCFTFKNKVREGVEMSCEMPEEAFLVNLDRIRVSQILSNFVTNSVKFTRGGFIKLGFVPMADTVKLYVEDTGCGMTSKQVENVFERFEKFDSFEQGTGLGTSIAKAIVDAYQGDIGVESELGKGTTFWAVLPTNIN